jgi:hypothetical protein
MKHPDRSPKKNTALQIALAFAIVLGLCMSASQAYRQVILKGGDAWRLGDWLINDAGGPVRRAVLGTMLMAVTSTAPQLLWLAWALQCGLLMLVCGMAVWQWRHTPAREPLSWALLLSPAFLPMFTALDPAGGFRKELLGFLAYLLLWHGLSGQRLKPWRVFAAWLLYLLAALAHELNALCAIFFWLLLLDARPRLQADAQALTRWAWVWAATGAGALALAVLLPGSPLLAQQVCSSLISRGLSEAICDGAIFSLGQSAHHWMAEVVRLLPIYLPRYGLLAALSVLPLLCVQGWPHRTRWALLGALCLLPLFVVAIDWGRWIDIWVFYMSCTCMMLAQHKQVQFRPVPAIVAGIWVLAWRMPHYNADGINDGLLRQLVSTLRHTLRTGLHFL